MTRNALLVAVPLVALAAGSATACRHGGCGDDMVYDEAATGAPTSGVPNDRSAGSRAVIEADVVQLDAEQSRIYAMSRGGSLAMVDAMVPGSLRLMGKIALSGQPFEMYRRGSVLLTMANNAIDRAGQLIPPAPEGSSGSSGSSGAADIAAAPYGDGYGTAAISAVDVADPAKAKVLSTFKVPGEIADSRIVGNVLYVASYESGYCHQCTGPKTLITTFDVSTPTAPRKVDQISYAPPSSYGYGGWQPYKRSIFATNTRIYVGGLASEDATDQEGVIEVVDIGDPTGTLKRGATIRVSGPIMNRWQMDEQGGYFRVISQHGAGRSTNGDRYPHVDVFRVDSTTAVTRVGQMTMSLPRQEGLKTVRFDGARAYAITFQQTDPLFTIDLSDPARPTQKGQLEIPGWVYHLEPRGEVLVGLGLDWTDNAGNLNVSLFDVADLAKPKLVQRVSFGPTNAWGEWAITNGVMAEDQDRIQKAFRIYDDGLIAVPFSAPGQYGTDACTGAASGIQLLDWSKTSLVKRALLPLQGNPRRVLRRNTSTMKELIGISDSRAASFTIDDRNKVVKNADLEIGACQPRYDYSMRGDDMGVSSGRGWGGGFCF